MNNILKNSRLINKIENVDLKNEFVNCYVKYSKFINPSMDLFREYTDHSTNHINYLIKSAEDLIPQTTLDKLNDMDIFVLLLSILYHDMAMHLSKEAIKILISDDKKKLEDSKKTGCCINYKEKNETKYKSKFISEKDNLFTLWKDYIKEIKKFDIDELNARLETKYKDAFFYKDLIELLDDENLLREFLRKKHHIISNRIAVNGFSLFEGKINFADQLYAFYHDLAGFIAKSHGISIRETFNSLKEIFYDDWKTPRGIHVIYHMIILRLADYVHITADRVNPYKTQIHKFISNRSKLETKKHIYTYESHRKYDSPGTLFFTSEPIDAEVFFEMDNLIDNIQSELDTSWGILGEVYGRSDLELNLRRIDSNLKYKNWRESQKYVTDSIKFKLDYRVISLLIEPLYGNNPSYAFRELIQNATDACRFLKNKKGELEGDSNVTYNPQVYIEFYENKKGQAFLRIKDNGTGMDLDILKNYYFNIGATFRKSDLFTKENSSKKIIRSGKFGIGMLTCFLLGDEIELKTKMSSDFDCPESKSQGYTLKTTLNQETIQINKDNNIEDGTEIIVSLNDRATEALKNDYLVTYEWFMDNDVEIVYKNFVSNKINDDNTQHNIVHISDWKKIEEYSDIFEIYWSQDFKIDKLQWKTFKSNGEMDGTYTLEPNLICNGIIIPEPYEKGIDDTIIKEWPTIYLKDLNGQLDLDLSRYKLNTVLPFIDDIRKEIYKNFIYQLLSIDELKLKDVLFDFRTGGIYKPQKIVFLKHGYTLFHPYFMQNENEDITLSRIYTSEQVEIDNEKIRLNFCDKMGYIFEKTSKREENYKYELTNCRKYNDIEFIDYNFMVRSDIYNEHNNTWNNRLRFTEKTRNFFNYSKIKSLEGEFLMKGSFNSFEKVENNINIDYLYDRVLTSLGLSNENLNLIISNKKIKSKNKDVHIFDEYFKDNKVIPYNVDERKEIFPKFTELAEQFNRTNDKG